jgi:hypothetical protein
MNALPWIACLFMSVPQEEQQALSSRQLMNYGSMEIRSVEFSRKEGDAESLITRVIHGRLQFDGDRLFTELQFGSGPEEFIPMSIERRLQDGSRRYEHHPSAGEAQRKIVVDCAESDALEHWTKAGQQLIDPRVIGLQPVRFALVWSCKLNEFMGAPDRQDVEVSRTPLDGRKTALVSFKWNGHVCREWLAEECDYQPLRAEIREASGTVYSQDCQLERVGTFWFPSRIILRDTDRFGEERERVETTISNISINDPSKKPEVTLALLELPVGNIVQNAAKPGTLIGRWDGKQIVKSSKQRSPLPGAAGADGPISSKVKWLALANLAVVCGLAILYVNHRRSRANSEVGRP